MSEDKIYPTMVIRSQAEAIELLEKENKQLKEELKSANEEITWWSNRFNAVERDNRKLKEDKRKAIDYIKDLYDVRFTDKDKRKLLEILGEKENE